MFERIADAPPDEREVIRPVDDRRGDRCDQEDLGAGDPVAADLARRPVYARLLEAATPRGDRTPWLSAAWRRPVYGPSPRNGISPGIDAGVACSDSITYSSHSCQSREGRSRPFSLRTPRPVHGPPCAAVLAPALMPGSRLGNRLPPSQARSRAFSLDGLSRRNTTAQASTNRSPLQTHAANS